MAQFGLRLGPKPRAIVATTPRPISIIRRFVDDPHTVVIRQRTEDNRDNLSDSFLERMDRTYRGTRLGRQELDAEILTDNPDALFKREDLDAARVAKAPDDLRRVVVAVDPSASGDDSEDADECGIVTGGTAVCACRGKPEKHLFVLADDSGVMSPAKWSATVRRVYERHRANQVVAEGNQGHAMVESVLRAYGGEHLPIKIVHASRGKKARAEMPATLVEQRKIHLVGPLARLTDQLVEWSPESSSFSPDRLDAFCWLVFATMLGGSGGFNPESSDNPDDHTPILPRRI